MAEQSVEYPWPDGYAPAAHAYVWPAMRGLLPQGEGLRMLDLGCGNGWVAGQLAALGHQVTGIDASASGIAQAQAHHPGVAFQVRSVYGDLSGLGRGGFDVVVSSEVIEHLYLPRVLLRQAFDLLCPGGVLLLTTPYHGYWKNLALSLANKWDDHFTVAWDGGHIKFFSERTLGAMLAEAGFEAARFANAGRLPWLWKSMVVRATKPVGRPPA